MSMKTPESLGATYDDAFHEVGKSLRGLERSVNAALFTLFPGRDFLLQNASQVKQSLDVDAIEINAIIQDKQVTICCVPHERPNIVTTVRDRDSLCVLTVGSNEALSESDIQSKDFYKGHPAVKWGAWCSSPIRVNDTPVGTVCALQSKAHEWTEKDRELIDAVALKIGDAVEAWAQHSRKDEDETDGSGRSES